MTKPILFVCQSCRLSDDGDEDGPSDGAVLLNQLLALHQQWSRGSELEIQPVGCLWTCRQACVATLQCSNKYTYLFTQLPTVDSAEALIEFSELHLDSALGNVPWKKIPEVLKTGAIARIPVSNRMIEDED